MIDGSSPVCARTSRFFERKMTGMCQPRHRHGSRPCTFAQLPKTANMSAANQWAPTAQCSRGRSGSHATSHGRGTACNSRISFEKVALTEEYAQHSRGACCTAWRTTRRPGHLLRHVLCPQLHCRDCVTSTCRIHAQLLRPPKRTAALHDLSRIQRCHADALLLPPVKASCRHFSLSGAEPGASNVVRQCRSRQAPSVNVKDLWDTLLSRTFDIRLLGQHSVKQRRITRSIL